eukprot:318026-Pelagomonas_calceolata.AAC.2
MNEGISKDHMFDGIKLMLAETISPAADQPESWAVGQPPLVTLVTLVGERAREQDSILKPKRAGLGVGVFKNNMLVILHMILGITNITGRRNGIIPCSFILVNRLNLSTAAEAALKPCMVGNYRVKTFAHDHNLTNRLHALNWLLKTYAIPAG